MNEESQQHEEPEPYFYDRKKCEMKGCKVIVGFFKLKDGMICGFCLDRLRRETHMELDELRDITLIEAHTYLK